MIPFTLLYTGAIVLLVEFQFSISSRLFKCKTFVLVNPSIVVGVRNRELQPQRGGGDLNKQNCIGRKEHPRTAMLVSFMDLSTKVAVPLFHWCSYGHSCLAADPK
jgi:hypothetical protein